MRGISILLLAAIGLFLGSWCASAETFEVIPPPQPVEVQPVDLATLVFQIVNNDPSPKTFSFDIQVAAQIQLVEPLGSLTIPSGGHEPIFVTVLVSEATLAGNQEITLKATLQTDATQTQSATGIIDVLPVSALEISPPARGDIEIGNSEELIFHLANRGNTADRFSLFVSSHRKIEVSLQELTIGLLPGEEQDVVLLVTIPKGTTPGIERLTLVGHSLTSHQETSAMAELNILPALPKDIGGTIFATIPASISVSLQGGSASALSLLTTLSGGGPLPNDQNLSFRLTLSGLTQVQLVHAEWETPQIGITLGDLSLAISNLMTMGGRGGSLALHPDSTKNSQAMLGAVTANHNAIIGGVAQFDLIGFLPTLSARFQPADQELLLGAGLGVPFGTLGALTFDTALSRNTTSQDQAIFLKIFSRPGNLAFHGVVFYAGRDFLGTQHDLLGLSFDQLLDILGISIQGRLRLARNNVRDDPSIKTIANTDIGAGAVLPLTAMTSFSSQFSFRRQRNPSAPVTTDLRKLSYVIQLTQKFGLFTLTALHSDERTQDFVAPTDLDRIGWRTSLGFQAGVFSSQLRLGLITETDMLTNTILASFLETSFAAQLRFSMATLALSLERLKEQLNAKIKMSMAFGNLSTGLENVVTYSILTGTLSYTFTLSAGIQFSLPVPLTPTKGRIEGVIFADQNGNGLRDADELNIENVVLSIAGERLRTDALGQFRSPPLEPGSVEIQLENLPPGYTLSEGFESSISLKAGEIEFVEIPVVQTGFIRGAVFEDANKNGARDSGERSLRNISISLSGPVNVTAQSDESGQFSVTLPPGHYQAILQQETLPKHFKPVGSASVEIDVEVGKIAVLTFRAAEVTEIRYAPSAEFTVTPENIHIGDSVTFDGSLSTDSDGQVVLYEWDFDGDGNVDATAEKVTHVFTSAGSFPVTLRVTDNDNNQNEASKTLTVQGE